jgi:SecD/SecF fusion protein
MKTRLWLGLLAALVLLVVGGGVWFFWLRPHKPPKPDFDQVGGTILIYEIDASAPGDGAAADMATRLAQSLQSRLDPDDLGLAVVAPAGLMRVEIRLPRTREDHGEWVKEVKALVAQMGRIEFRILANSADDAEAIQEAALRLNTADQDPQVKAELDNAQEDGRPPPPPRQPGTKEPKRYTIRLRGSNSIVSYSWVELGKQERQQLGLNVKEQAKPGPAWEDLAKSRGKAVPARGAAGQTLLHGALFFSRDCLDRNLPAAERSNKRQDYFVLTRGPEIDPTTGKETPQLDGSYVISASNQPDKAGKPAVAFTFNAAGGRLLGDLSSKNLPSGDGAGQVKRHLAIILDGLVVSAPTINSETRQYGQISGNFTNKEVDQMVNILRAGALPFTVRPDPVSQQEVAPKKDSAKTN